MNLLVISDLHLNPDSTERNHHFLDFLQSARDRQDRVLIVGDLFDLWFGWKDLTMEFQKLILQQMFRLTESGLLIDYVEGNRDFGIAAYRPRIFQRVESGPYQTKWAEKLIHAEHGDLINESDRPYRLWRFITKNRFSYFLMSRLPAFLTLQLGLRLERGMKVTNRKNKTNYPEQNAEDFYLNLFRSGVDIVIVGHFHVEKVLSIRMGNRSVLFYSLPGWEQGFRYLVIPPDSATPYFRDWGKQNGNSATA